MIYSIEMVTAALIIDSAVNNAAYLRPRQRTGTHRARLNGYIQCAVGQVFAANVAGCRRYGLHLGVGRHIVERLSQVAGAGDYLAVSDNHGANGHLVLLEGDFGLLKGLAHI